MKNKLSFWFNFAYLVHINLSLVFLQIVLITYYVDDQKSFLEFVTKEDGVYEYGTAFFLLLIAIVLFTALFLKKSFSFNKIEKWLIGLSAVLFLWASGEEISWGQRILGIESEGVFAKYNIQKETNLHNFIDGQIFMSLVVAVFFLLFVIAPVLYKIFNIHHKESWINSLKIFLPSNLVTNIFLFSFVINHYDLPDDHWVIWLIFYIGVILYLIFYCLFAYFLFTVKSYWIEWACLILTPVLFFVFYFHSDIFSFFNLQGEVKEFVFAYALFFWCFDILRNKKEIDSMSTS